MKLSPRLFCMALRPAAMVSVLALSACAKDDITGAIWPASQPKAAVVETKQPEPQLDPLTKGQKMAQTGDALAMEGRDLVAEGHARIAEGERMAAEGKRIQEEARAGHISRHE